MFRFAAVAVAVIVYVAAMGPLWALAARVMG